MSLTTEQRLRVYEVALYRLKNMRQPDKTICYCIFKAMIALDTGYYSLTEFLEIIKQKPDHISKFYPSQTWFPENKEGKLKRIAILEQAIEDCKQQLNPPGR